MSDRSILSNDLAHTWFNILVIHDCCLFIHFITKPAKKVKELTILGNVR
jgi:hypothetical protein